MRRYDSVAKKQVRLGMVTSALVLLALALFADSGQTQVSQPTVSAPKLMLAQAKPAKTPATGEKAEGCL